MGFIKNMKIRAKLIILLIVALVSILTVSTTGLWGLYLLNDMQDRTYQTVVLPTGYMMHFSNAYGNIRAQLRDFAYETDPATYASYEQKLNDNYTIIQKAVKDYQAYMDAYDIIDESSGEEYEHFIILADALPELQQVIKTISASAKGTDVDETMSLIKNELVPLTNIIQPALDELITHNTEQAAADNIDGSALFTRSMWISDSAMVVSAIFLILLALLIIRSITKPVRHMVEAAGQVARGNLNVNLRTDTKDELGLLAHSLATLVATIQKLTDDLTALSKKHDEGDTDALIDETAYEGAYGELAHGLNNMLSAYVTGTFEILECLDGFGQGNFNAALRPFPGKKSQINKSVDALRGNLNAVSGEIRTLVSAALEGQLSKRADSTHYAGDWAQIINGLNNVLNAVVLPIKEAADVMDRLSQGDFSRTVTGDYKGDFAIIKQSLNTTVANISSYIKDISAILSQLANNNLNLSVTREYLGDFSVIKDAMNQIIDKLNNVMDDISTASEQVAAGAKQISESSMTLAEGATEQASSVEELTATVTQINEKTAHNAENASKAESLASAAKDNASVGNKEMREMLESMENIREASNNIANIIKVIDEIALQTNLLALNASVEAARAGQHGKGFTVVADEVRNLAAKSKKAAQQTTELIEDSIEKVAQGTRIAKNTAESLERIISDVTEVSTIITGIASASGEQADAISQINVGANQIAEVVQRNSATSEESAAASEELSSQSELLRNMISVFKLRKKGDKPQTSIAPTVRTQPVKEEPANYYPSIETKPATVRPVEVRPAVVKPATITHTAPKPAVVRTEPPKPAPPKPAPPKPAPPKPALTKPAAKRDADDFSPAKPNMAQPSVTAPSGAHEYDKRDFGKY